jgi:hypothetical protein
MELLLDPFQLAGRCAPSQRCNKWTECGLKVSGSRSYHDTG